MKSVKRVCVVMGDDRPILLGDAARASYPSLAYEINRRFCERNGWDFRYEHYQLRSRPWGKLSAYSTAARQHRAASWVKLLAILRALELGHEIVIWIDSDCIFYCDDADWSDFLGLFGRGDLHLAAWVDRPYSEDQLCAGFFAVRNDAPVRDMLRLLWERPSPTSFRHAYEQVEFQRFLRSQPPSWHHLMHEPMFALEDPKQRLLHLATDSRHLRLPIFLRWFEDRRIPPHPQHTERHVHVDLDIGLADERLSGRRPGLLESAEREAWPVFQQALGLARRVRSRIFPHR